MKIVDILGGVQVDVERGLRYIDKTGGIYINVPKGQQYLCGEKAVQYIRFIPKRRVDDRIERQQQMINALAKKVFKHKELIKALKRCVDTNLSLRDIITLVSLGEKKRDCKVSIFKIAGQSVYLNGVNYWKINLVRTKRLLKELDSIRL